MRDGAAPRVLLLAPHHPPEAGAAATRLASLAAGLRAEGHEVLVIAPTPGSMVPRAAAAVSASDESVRRAAVTPRGRGRLANALFQWRLRAALRREAELALRDFAADVVLVSSPPPVAALAGLGLRAQGGRKVLPVVLDVRDIWPDVLVQAGIISHAGLAARVLRRVERRLLAGASAITTVTEDKVRVLSRRAPGLRVELVANGVDQAWAEGGPAYAGGGDSGPFRVLHAGNVGLAQDVGLLVRAVGRPSGDGASSRPLEAVIVGEGEDLPAVLALAGGNGAAASFHPVEPRESVKERLAACGAAFVTLRTKELTDAVPSKLLEALARGVPVVLAAAGESARLLEASGGGVVVPPGDAVALAAALHALAALPVAERLAQGARGRAFVLARFRREDSARVLSHVLRECAVRSVQRRVAP